MIAQDVEERSEPAPNSAASRKWNDLRPLLFMPALLISSYLAYRPGLGFWFIGAQNVYDWIMAVPALTVFLVILAIWWSPGPTFLLIVWSFSFFYVCMHRLGNTYSDLRRNGLNPGLLISVNILMIIIAVADILMGRAKPRFRFSRK